MWQHPNGSNINNVWRRFSLFDNNTRLWIGRAVIGDNGTYSVSISRQNSTIAMIDLIVHRKFCIALKLNHLVMIFSVADAFTIFHIMRNKTTNVTTMRKYSKIVQLDLALEMDIVHQFTCKTTLGAVLDLVWERISPSPLHTAPTTFYNSSKLLLDLTLPTNRLESQPDLLTWICRNTLTRRRAFLYVTKGKSRIYIILQQWSILYSALSSLVGNTDKVI